MTTIRFLPVNLAIDVPAQTKILAAANRVKAPIRFGCASCRCGTCGVLLRGTGTVTPMQDNERQLLTRMGLDPNSGARLACQTRILSGDIEVDLDFQNTYSPDDIEGAE